MTAPARICRHLRITGRVQGVWYRGWAGEQAQALGLDGWVRNRRDGSVEAVVAGPARAVEAFVERCHLGPPAARVDGIQAAPWDEPVAAGFHQRATI
jgi:acylphosphatase